MDLEYILKDRVAHLIRRAKMLKNTNRKLSDFLLDEAKQLCSYHDADHPFMFMLDPKEQ